jgi:hypothetical protein
MKRIALLLGGALIVAGCGRQADNQQATAVNGTDAAAPGANAVVPAGESSGHSIVDTSGATVGFVAGTLIVSACSSSSLAIVESGYSGHGNRVWCLRLD